MRKLNKILLFIITAFILSTVFSLSSFAMTDSGKIVVVLDPGHGGDEDPGTCAASSPEYVYTTKVANYCKQYLDADGRFKTVLTRTSNDVALTKLERQIISDDNNADICISIHFDANESSDNHGLSGYVSVVPKYKKETLAQKMLELLNEATGIDIYEKGVQAIQDKGTTLYYWNDELNWSFADSSKGSTLRDYYGILKWGAYLGVPTVIIEHGFMTNPSDLKIIENENTLKSMGIADAKAIIDYYTNHTHTFGNTTVDYPSNCIFVGKQSQKCTVCGARKNVSNLSDDSENHYWIKTKTVSAECEKDGYIEYTCEYSAATASKDEGKEGFCKVHKKRKFFPLPGITINLFLTRMLHTVPTVSMFMFVKTADVKRMLLQKVRLTTLF